MSTTIKPLDIYIGGTKVFPDVNTDILAYPVYSVMYEDTQTLNSIHRANMYDTQLFDNYNLNYVNMLVLPVMEDTNNSPWHTNEGQRSNYWCFFDRNNFRPIHVLEIPFLINQNWLADYFASVGGRLFEESLATSINFDPNTSMPNTVGYDEDDHSIKTVDILYCREMFGGCTSLKEIHGLNLSGQREHLINSQYFNNICFSPQINDYEWLYEDIKDTFSNMFSGCKKLTTLDITWPEALPGTNYPVLYGNVDHMFFGCSQLTDVQIPTFALRPISQGDTIKILNFLGGTSSRDSISSLHITDDSWPYIEDARGAWSATNIQSIDIPATATNLSYIKYLLGESLYTPTSGDYSDNKYIIRTEKPMSDYLNDNDDEHVRLFNFGNYNDNSDFLSTFGGIYIPDNQLSDWQTYISNAGGSNIASNHVHGLSDL